MTVSEVTVAIEPERDPHLVAAVEGAGGRVVPLDQARVLVWIGAGPGGFPELTDDIEWVALKTAGIEAFVGAGVIDAKRLWTNASGFYAEGVAEHALALLLAGLRQINTSVLRHWDKQPIDTGVRTLRGARVAIVGAGGIGASLIPRLTACGASTIAVNRSGRPVEGAALTLPADRLDEVWAELPFEASWLSEAERVKAEDALARFVNWQQTNSHADVVGVEVPFDGSARRRFYKLVSEP